KDDSPDSCAERLDALIKAGGLRDVPEPEPRPEPLEPYQFETVTNGMVTFDHAVCATCETKICIEECARQILSLNDDGHPVLNITREEAKKGQCVECLACEVACLLQGAGGGTIHLPIPQLDETRA
ncbi:MAG: hypothetical protein PVG25_09315, partial [Anaerolineae bacterium]